MSIFHMIKDVLIRPSYFFERIEKQKGISKAFFYLLILSLFYSIVSLLLSLLFFKYFSNINISGILGISFPRLFPKPQITLFTILATSLVGYIVGLLFSFVIAGLLHAWIYIFGGKATYDKTYQILVYSGTPNYLFGWIPYLRSLAQIYHLVLLVIGTQKIHKVSLARAIIIYAIPVAVIILVLVIIFVLMISFVASNPALFQQAIANQAIIN